MSDPDKARRGLANLDRALESLRQAVEKPSLTDLELAGAIQNFEFCYELGWKTLKKHAESLGRTVASPREAFRYAQERGWIGDERLWLDMIEDRNRTVHTYDRAVAERVYQGVKLRYFAALGELAERIRASV